MAPPTATPITFFMLNNITTLLYARYIQLSLSVAR